MAAITTKHEVSIVEIPTYRIAGTATPNRRANVYAKFDSTGATDTFDVNAQVSDNINSIIGMPCVVKGAGTSPSGSGTVALTWSGTSLTTLGGAGVYDVHLVVALK